MSSFNSFSENAAEFYDFTNLHELRNACYNLSAQKILDYANNADADEVISLLIVLEGKKRLEFIHGLDLSQLAAMAEDLHTSELNELMNELPQEKRDRLMYRLSDHVLYQLSRLKD
jgi:Mg/Co/Ni transporter MgtE